MSDNIKYTIFSLRENYQVLKTAYEKVSFTGTIDEVLKKLRKNKGYNIRINPKKDCIAYGDFDHTTKENFKDFLNILCDKFEVTLDQISYTKSKKENEYSYHWSIPSIQTTPEFLKDLFTKSETLKKYIKPNEHKQKQLDTKVYDERFLRLPGQTNDEKPLEHRIMRGEMKHFIVECLDSVKSIIKFDEEDEEEEDEEEEDEEEKELDIEKVNKYLELLDADIDYNDWLSVGMALKNEG